MTYEEIEIIEKVIYLQKCSELFKELNKYDESGFTGWMADKQWQQGKLSIKASDREIREQFQRISLSIVLNEELEKKCNYYVQYAAAAFDIYKGTNGNQTVAFR